jgi:hypothetical protein
MTALACTPGKAKHAFYGTLHLAAQLRMQVHRREAANIYLQTRAAMARVHRRYHAPLPMRAKL